MFQSDIPTVHGRRSEEGDGVTNGEGGDPGITHTLKNDVKHLFETDKLDEFGVGRLFSDEKDSLDGMRYRYDSQFEQLRVSFVFPHETDEDLGVFGDLGPDLRASMVSDGRQCYQGHMARVLLFEEWE